MEQVVGNMSLLALLMAAKVGQFRPLSQTRSEGVVVLAHLREMIAVAVLMTGS